MDAVAPVALLEEVEDKICSVGNAGGVQIIGSAVAYIGRHGLGAAGGIQTGLGRDFQQRRQQVLRYLGVVVPNVGVVVCKVLPGRQGRAAVGEGVGETAGRIVDIGVVHCAAVLGHTGKVVGGVEQRLPAVGLQRQGLDVFRRVSQGQGILREVLGREFPLWDGGPGAVFVNHQGDAPKVGDGIGGLILQNLRAGGDPGSQLAQVHFPEPAAPPGGGDAGNDLGFHGLKADLGLRQSLQGL